MKTTRRATRVPVASGADSVVAFSIDVSHGDDRSAEQWARAAFEGAPTGLRWLMVAGWRLALGLRLGPLGSADHILGWSIAGRNQDETVLESRSSFVSAQNVFRREGTRLVWSTVVHYDRPIAKLIWPPVALLHCRIAPYTLRRAANSWSG